MQNRSPIEHPYPMPNSHVFGLFGDAVHASDNFSYSSQRGTNELESGAIYAQYRPESDQLGLLDLVPRDMPQSLIWYRLCWHRHLSGQPGFMQQLIYKNVSHGRYFRDVERSMRACFDLLAQPHAIPGLGHYKKTLHDMATRHAASFAECYFANASPQALGVHLLHLHGIDTSGDAVAQQIQAINWAVSAAIPYAGTLLGIELHPAQLTDATWYQREAPIFGTEAINLAYEAGYRIARQLMVRLLPVRGHYQASDSALAAIMTQELCATAHQQRPLTGQTRGMEQVEALVQDAHANHEALLLHRMYELCQQSRIRQDLAARSMQQFLALYFSDEEEPEAKFRDQEQERAAPVQEQAGEQAVDAGLVILEYFRNIKFGDKSEAQAVEAEHGEAVDANAADEEEDSASNTGNKKSKIQFDIQNMEFEVSINGEETKRLKLTQIFNALRGGSTVRFASKAQARTFVNAVTKMAQQGIDPGFEMAQIEFVEKGQVQRITRELIEDIQDELMRHHQMTALQMQWLQHQHDHSPTARYAAATVAQHDGQAASHAPVVGTHHQAEKHTGLPTENTGEHGSKLSPEAQQAGKHAQPAQHAPQAEGAVENDEHSPKAKGSAKATAGAKQAAIHSSTVAADLLSDAKQISKPDAPEPPKDAGKEIGR